MRRLLAILAVWVVLYGSTAYAQDNCGSRLSAADQQLFDKAVEAYQAGHYADCSTLMRKVSAKNPKAADSYFYLGMAAVGRDDNPGAIRRYFTKLLNLCPDYPDALAHFYKGVVCYTDNQFDEAVGYFNRYFEIANNQNKPEWNKVYEEASNYLYWSQFLGEAYANPVPFNPRTVKGVSSKTTEMLPYLTYDGQTMYYIRSVPQIDNSSFYQKEMVDKLPRIMESYRLDTAFTVGTELDYPFNQRENEGGVSLTADNRVLYYSAIRQERNYANCDIWYAEWEGNHWSELKNAGRTVNGEKSWDSQPSVSADGQFLYFASNRTGGQGGTDIWFCRRLPNGDWGRAENMGPSVNTAGNEKFPYICADGKTLFFASDGWQGFGGYDFFMTNLDDNYSQRPQNLGHPINGEEAALNICVSADGRTAYFAQRATELNAKLGTRIGVGEMDVFSFELYPAVRPEAMLVRKCALAGSRGGALQGEFWVARQGATTAKYKVKAADGTFAAAFSMDEHNVVAAMADGFVPKVAVVAKDQVKQMPKKQTDAWIWMLDPVSVGGECLLEGRFYDGRNNRITPEGELMMEVYADFILSRPNMKVRIEGRTADETTAIHNYLHGRKLRPERLDKRTNEHIDAARLVITQL